MITSGVIRPPAVPSSYSRRRRTTSASSSSITLEHAFLIGRRHLSDEVGEVVVLHLVEHADESVEVEFGDDAHLLLLRQLLEHVGEALVVHRLGELAALVDGQRAHDGGDLGRVEVAAAGRPRPASRSGRRTARAPRRSRRGDSSGRRRSVLLRERRTRSITQYDDRLPMCSRRAMSLTRLVADLAVDQLGADQHLAGPWLEGVEVDVPAAQPGAVAVEAGDPVGVDEDPAPLAAGDEPDDAWRDRLDVRRARPARDHHDVFEPADLGAARIEQREPHHPECVDQLTGHAGRLPMACCGNRDGDRCVRGGRCGARPGWSPGGALPRGDSDLDQRVAVRHATAPVGEGVVGEAVGDLAVGVRGAPPTERNGDHSRAQPVGDPDGHLDRRAVVPDAARSPSARPRRAASAASSSTNGPPSAGPCLGRCE